MGEIRVSKYNRERQGVKERERVERTLKERERGQERERDPRERERLRRESERVQEREREIQEKGAVAPSFTLFTHRGLRPPGRDSRRPPAKRRRRGSTGVAIGHPTGKLGRGSSPSLQQNHGLALPGRGLAGFRPRPGTHTAPRAAPCVAGEGGGARPPQGGREDKMVDG